jgi:hypothetical protein
LFSYDSGVRLLLVLAVLPLFAACGGSTGSSGARGTVLHGTVASGPPGGACPEGQTCGGPSKGVTLRFLRDGSEVASVRTGDQGTYRVTLPAGQYAVEGPQPLKPRHVIVPEGGPIRVDFSVDSKIS